MIEKDFDLVKTFEEEIAEIPRFADAADRRDWVMAKLEEDKKDPEFAEMLQP